MPGGLAQWIKEVKLETVGRANYFSKPIKNTDSNGVDPNLIRLA